MPVSVLTFSTSACTLCKNSGTSDAWYFFPALILVWWSYQHWWVTLFFKHGVQPYLSTLSDIIGSLISLSNGSEDRSKKEETTSWIEPSTRRIQHVILHHYTYAICVRTSIRVSKYHLDLSGLYIREFWKFCDFCPDYIRDTPKISAKSVRTTIRVPHLYSGVLLYCYAYDASLELVLDVLLIPQTLLWSCTSRGSQPRP